MSKKSKMSFFESFDHTDKSAWATTKRLNDDEFIIRSRGSLSGSCEHCGQEYRIKSATHKYCSKACSRQSMKDKRKARGFSEYSAGKLRFLVFNRDNFRCIYCGRATWDTDNLTLHADHIHPASKGGADTIDNLVTSCSECNVAKGADLVYNVEEILAEVQKRNKQIGKLKEKLNDS